MFAILMPGGDLAWNLASAHALSRLVGAELILGLPAVSEEEFVCLRSEVEALLTAMPGVVRVLRLPGLDARDMARAARSLHAGLVVVPASLPAAELASFLNTISCPLLLLMKPPPAAG